MVSLNQIPGVVLIFGIIVIFGVVMATLVTDLKSDTTTDAADFNFSADSEKGLLNIGAKLPLLGTIVILAAVIGVVVGVFRFKGGGF